MARSKFAGIKGTRMAGSGGAYFTNGKHLARIDRIKSFEDGMRVERTAIEFTILKTLEPGPDDETHRTGEEVSKLWEDKSVWFLGQFKQFIAAALGLTGDDAEEQITEEVCEEIIDSEKQPLAGQIMLVYGRPKRTQAGKMITVTTFLKSVPHNEVSDLLGDDAGEILERCYRDKTGFRSMTDFESRVANADTPF